MEIKPREQIAIALFTGAIISLFIFLGENAKNIFYPISIFLILIAIIFISLKIILTPKIDLHDIWVVKLLKNFLL